MADDEIVVHDGSARIIVAAIARDGKAHAVEYLDSLDSARLGKAVKANFFKTFEKVCGSLIFRNNEKFEALSGDHARGIYEFKKDEHRIFAYHGGSSADGRHRIVLTHGFPKQKEKTPANQIERAVRIRKEYEERPRQKR